MDMFFEEDHHSAHDRGPGLKWKQRQNQTINLKPGIAPVLEISSLWWLWSQLMCMQSFGTTSQAPQSVFCPVQRRNVSEICTLSFLAAYRGWVGDWPRPSHQVDPPCPSSALLAPSNSQLLSSQSCPWSHGGCPIRRLCIRIPPPTRGWWLTRGRRYPFLHIRSTLWYNLCPRGPDGTTLKPSKPYPSFIFSLALFSFSCSFPPEHTLLIHCLLKNPHLRLCFSGDPN